VHDLRRTVKSGLARLQVPEHVAERMLADIDDGVRRNCSRYTYLEKSRDARRERRVGSQAARFPRAKTRAKNGCYRSNPPDPGRRREGPES